MRKQFVKSIKEILYKDINSVLLLGDIGVFGFREELKNIPSRAYNIGILEQSTISLAAGLSRTGLIPFVHTIAPFLVERALEQLKIDFGYQELNGNFISVGSSYDYAALGCTHHCPGDIQILLSIPNLKIFIPGTSEELNHFLLNEYNSKYPKYYRLSEYENTESFISTIGEATVVKKGSKATIVCFGNILSSVLKASSELDVTILYYNCIVPFDIKTLQNNFNEKIIICEPFYEGTTNHLVTNALKDKKCCYYNIGIPRKFLFNYGTKIEHDTNNKLDVENIKERIKACLI
jgi:transketolase